MVIIPQAMNQVHKMLVFLHLLNDTRSYPQLVVVLLRGMGICLLHKKTLLEYANWALILEALSGTDLRLSKRQPLHLRAHGTPRIRSLSNLTLIESLLLRKPISLNRHK